MLPAKTLLLLVPVLALTAFVSSTTAQPPSLYRFYRMAGPPRFSRNLKECAVFGEKGKRAPDLSNALAER